MVSDRLQPHGCHEQITMETRRDVFQALSDPTRREIMNVIASKPLTSNVIAERFDVSRQAISRHLRILEECGLIEINQQGRQRYCFVQPQKLNEVEDWLQNFKKIWEKRFNKLDDILKNMKQTRKYGRKK